MVFGVFAQVTKGRGLFNLFRKFVDELMLKGVDLVLQLLLDLLGHAGWNYKPCETRTLVDRSSDPGLAAAIRKRTDKLLKMQTPANVQLCNRALIR